MSDIPIVYIVFNRPRHTKITFDIIRVHKPSKLFIIADGPRPEHPSDVERCAEVRDIVAEISWNCEVFRNYSDHNLGCKQRVVSGLNWVFENVDRAIVLEDDILPNQDFFHFCNELLDFYKDDDRVACITGNNFQNGHQRGVASYYFSRYNHVWGWATWRRAWMNNNPTLSFWPEWKKSKDWHRKLLDSNERNYWGKIFDKMFNNEIDTWDYPWTGSVWYQGGLTATPNVNLVTNIGFGPDATHTVEVEDLEGQQSYRLEQITHPQEVQQNRDADRYTFNHHFGGANNRLYVRLLRLARLVARKIITNFFKN